MTPSMVDADALRGRWKRIAKRAAFFIVCWFVVIPLAGIALGQLDAALWGRNAREEAKEWMHFLSGALWVWLYYRWFARAQPSADVAATLGGE